LTSDKLPQKEKEKKNNLKRRKKKPPAVILYAWMFSRRHLSIPALPYRDTSHYYSSLIIKFTVLASNSAQKGAARINRSWSR
jgi:hypothetical protein